MKTRTVFAALLAAFAVAAPSAAAATLDDVRALGYDVGIAQALATGCTTYYISGFGIGVYANSCDATYQSTLDSIGDPAVHMERRWQFEHPDQFTAAKAISGKCYAISRTAVGSPDWHIIGGSSDLIASGSDLVALADSLPSLKEGDTCLSGASQITPTTGSDGRVTTPGSAPIEALVAAIVGTATQVAASAETAHVEAVAVGLPADEAALAARSAGMNALYGLGA